MSQCVSVRNGLGSSQGSLTPGPVSRPPRPRMRSLQCLYQHYTDTQYTLHHTYYLFNPQENRVLVHR